MLLNYIMYGEMGLLLYRCNDSEGTHLNVVVAVTEMCTDIFSINYYITLPLMDNDNERIESMSKGLNLVRSTAPHRRPFGQMQR